MSTLIVRVKSLLTGRKQSGRIGLYACDICEIVGEVLVKKKIIDKEESSGIEGILFYLPILEGQMRFTEGFLMDPTILISYAQELRQLRL